MKVVSHRTTRMSALHCQWAGYHDQVYLDLAALALPTSLPRLGVWAASTDHGEEQKRECFSQTRDGHEWGPIYCRGRVFASVEEYKATLTLNEGGDRHKRFGFR